MSKAAKTVALVALGALFALPGPLAAQHAPDPGAGDGAVQDPWQVTADQWREDLHFLAQAIRSRHPNPFHSVSEESFEAAIGRLEGRIPELTYPQILVEFSRLVAMLGEGDGHSRVRLTPHFITSGGYPLSLWLFSDGLFVRSADPRYAGLVGQRVVWIGNAKTEDAIERLRAIVPGDNEAQKNLRIPFYMIMPEVMEGVGLVEERGRLAIVTENELGMQSSAVVTPVPFPETHEGTITNLAYKPLRLGAPDEWPSMRDMEESPLYLRDPNDWYWYEYLADERTLYVQFNVVGDKEEGESVEQFFDRLFALAERNDVERFVLDIRLNGGGNNFLARPIWYGLVGNKQLNQLGKLYVIIGRATFSAAQNLATILDEHTEAVFVGEPTGGRPNAYGDARAVTLPNSGLRVSISTLYWQDAMPWDDRAWVAPEIAADLTSADYARNRDPALETILALSPEEVGRPFIERLQAAYQAGGLEAAVEAYLAYKADPAHLYVSTDGPMNRAGYFLLGEGLVEEAIRIFQLNVEAYPDSWNVHDSLGEAYMAAGQTGLAIQSYEKALEINPDNDNAISMLEKLRSEEEG